MATVPTIIRETFPNLRLTSMVNIITYFIIFIIVMVIFGIGTYILYSNSRYRKKLVIFEKVAGRFEPTRKDRGMEIKLEYAGDTVLYLKRHKKYLPTPTIQTGRNTYWYAIREDGEWINIGIEDIDERMREVKAHFLETEMRYARVALQRNLKERYAKPSFLSVYGGLIAYTGLIAITAIMMWLLFDKYMDILSQVDATVTTSRAVMETATNVMSALDNICTNRGLG